MPATQSTHPLASRRHTLRQRVDGVLPRSAAMRVLLLAGLAFVAAAVFAATYLHTRAKLKFDVETSGPASLQVFHSADGVFREPDSHVQALPSGSQRIRLHLPAGHGGHLRIDPAPGSPDIRLCELRARDGRLVLYDVVGQNQMAVHRDGDCLVLASLADGGDPYVVLASQGDVQGTMSAGWRAQMALALMALAGSGLAALRIIEANRTIAQVAESAFGRLSRHAHWITLASMLVCGSLILHALPPNGVPDEPAHLSKIAKVHGGVLLGDSGAAPLIDVAGMYGTLWDRVPGQPAADPQLVERQVRQPLDCAREPRALPTSADQYAPHLYLGPAVAMAMSCEVGASFGGFLDAARILNLLLGACLVAFGVRQAAYGKWALFVVALLPMTISQIASISADAMILSLTLCFLGVVSGVAGGRLAHGKARLLLPFLALLLAFAKPGAAWILVAVLFCYPAYRDRRRGFAELLATSVVVPWMIHIGWTLWSAGNAHYGPGVDPEANKALLLEQPALVLRMLFNTFLGDGLPHLYNSMIGRLGWLDIPLAAWAYPVAGGMLLASLWTNPEGTRIPAWVRILSLGAAAGSLALLALPLLLTWTQPGAAVVQGLQGRYFLPTLAFVLVFNALRARPVARILLLACVLSTPLLTMDALSSIHLRYQGTGT